MTDVYCTLLLNDSYLPGAQVLSQSLRDGGTTKKLAVMVTLESVSESTVTCLKRLYDFVIPVDSIRNEATVNLALMDRLDLNATFTKINLWKLTQFRKILYVDADVVSLRSPDELFDLDSDFAAAPDIGWPDCFNSGVMLLRPSMGTYYSLLQLAGRGVSFDGADQGLLNSYFKKWDRISFIYNCTPSGHYQYTPAFTHYGSNISMAHFIGAEKPWNIDRSSLSGSGSSKSDSAPYNQLLGHWWGVWDKHFGGTHTSSSHGGSFSSGGSSTQRSSGGSSSQYKQAYSGPTGNQAGQSTPQGQQQYQPQQRQYQQQQQQQQQQQFEAGPSGTRPVAVRPAPIKTQRAVQRAFPGELVPEPQQMPFQGSFPEVVSTPQGPVDQMQFFQTGPRTYEVSKVQVGRSLPRSASRERKQTPVEPQPPVVPFSTPYYNWDPTRFAPPVDSAPEANMFPRQFYQNEWDNPPPTRPAVTAPTAQAPPPAQKRRAENRQPARAPQEAPLKQIFPWENKPRTTTRVFDDDVQNQEDDEEEEDDEEDGTTEGSQAEEDNEEREGGEEDPVTAEEAKAWRTYIQENEWDAIPGIQDYVSDLKRRHTQGPDGIPRIPGYFVPLITQERPSLPVTPNPVRRRTSQQAPEEHPLFPSAQGIPSQEDWDPHAKLNELTRLPRSLMISDATQTDVQKGSAASGVQTEIPATPLSPTYSDSSVQTESPKLEDRGTQWDNPDWVEDKKSLSGSSSASLKTESDLSISIGKQSLESQSPPKSPESKEKEKRRSMNLQKLLPKYWGTKTPESRRQAASR